jgi:hypothetical protein
MTLRLSQSSQIRIHWSIGVPEYWSIGIMNSGIANKTIPKSHNSSIPEFLPIFHHSIIPFETE